MDYWLYQAQKRELKELSQLSLEFLPLPQAQKRELKGALLSWLGDENRQAQKRELKAVYSGVDEMPVNHPQAQKRELKVQYALRKAKEWAMQAQKRELKVLG